MSEDPQARQKRHFDYLRNQIGDLTARPRTGVPSPPYHLRDINAVFSMCAFTRSSVAALLPEGLDPSDSGTGVFGFYQVERGWGIAPYTAFYCGLEVKGFDSPDGSPGVFIRNGYFSGLAAEAFHSLYNSYAVPGGSRLTWVDGVATAEGFRDPDRPEYRMVARAVPVETGLFTAINRNLGLNSAGQLTSCLIALSASYQPIEVTSLTALSDAADSLSSLEIKTVLWSVRMFDMAITFSPPRLLSDSEGRVDTDTQAVNLLATFAQLGRAAAILDQQGNVLHLNGAAERLASEKRLRLRQGSLVDIDAPRLAQLIASITPARGEGPSGVSESVLLGTGVAGPLILQIMPIAEAVAGPGALLALFSDPAQPDRRDTIPALRLLGLTEAEARIAAAVGGGLSPKDAAEALQLSPNTVRSTLKVVFGKLGIGRQAELAKIVTRIEAHHVRG